MTNTSWKELLHRYCVRVLLLTWLLSIAMQSQIYNVIHTFTAGADETIPIAGLTLHVASNLYGTTSVGALSYGTAFRLKRSGATWIFELLRSFTDGTDGAFPEGRIIFGPNGALYGTLRLAASLAGASFGRLCLRS
jgi:hypothetical protein